MFKKGTVAMAHRMAWFLKHGKWPAQDLLHKCDNPACVRLSHVFEGNDLENARDRTRKGRSASHKGTLNGRAKFTEADVLTIRRTYAAGKANQPELAAMFNTTQSRISEITRMKSWRHLV
jgi:hypothetical protein